MSFFDLLIGSEQSKYAAIAIISVIFVICMSFLINNTDVSLSERFVTVILLILIVLLPACLALFELTCIVNGDSKNSDTYCGYYAWAITLIIIIHCVIIIVSTFSSMFVYKKAKITVEADKKVNTLSPANAKQIAENMMNYDESQKSQEKKDLVTPFAEPKVEEKKKPDEKKQGGADHLLDVMPNSMIKDNGDIQGLDTGDYANIE